MKIWDSVYVYYSPFWTYLLFGRGVVMVVGAAVVIEAMVVVWNSGRDSPLTVCEAWEVAVKKILMN